jgi:hypothetical protein
MNANDKLLGKIERVINDLGAELTAQKVILQNLIAHGERFFREVATAVSAMRNKLGQSGRHRLPLHKRLRAPKRSTRRRCELWSHGLRLAPRAVSISRRAQQRRRVTLSNALPDISVGRHAFGELGKPGTPLSHIRPGTEEQALAVWHDQIEHGNRFHLLDSYGHGRLLGVLARDPLPTARCGQPSPCLRINGGADLVESFQEP